MFAVALSMLINDWWTYGLYSEVIVASCADPSVSGCHAFCGDTTTIPVQVTTDDYQFEYDDLGISKSVTVTSSSTDSPYCIAELPGGCAYKYWLVFKLVPVLLHVLMFQYLALLHLKTFSPQQRQFDIILGSLHPTLLAPEAGPVQDGPAASARKGADIEVMLAELRHPRAFNVFAFLEVCTVIYVWGELVFPPTFCGEARPLSLFYYPILMTLSDLIRLNVYVATKLVARGRHFDAILVLAHVGLVWTHAWTTCYLAANYMAGLLSVVLAPVVQCCRRYVLGEKHEWAGDATPNPLAAGTSGSDTSIADPDVPRKQIALVEQPPRADGKLTKLSKPEEV